MPATATGVDGRPVATWRFGPFSFDPASGLLRRGDQDIPLPPRVLGILELLLARAGEVVRRQELIERVWKDAFVTDTSLAEAISFLRQALGDDPQAPTYVQTVHRRGYRFIAPVARESGGPVASAREAAIEVREPVSPSIARDLLPWTAAALLGALALAATWQLVAGGRTAAPPTVRFPIALAPGTRFDDRAPALAITRDGTRIAWSGCDASGCRLYLRVLDRFDVKTLPGTAGASAPFFSPDGAWLGFFADGQLKKVSVSGGAPFTIADVPDAAGGAWGNGVIVYAGSPASGLMQVSDQGGEPLALTVPQEDRGEVRHVWPAFMDDGRTVVFTILTSVNDAAQGRIGVLSLDGPGRQPAWRALLNGVGLVRPSRAGAIVCSRGGELQAVGFDRTRVEVTGVPQTVIAGVAPGPGFGQFDLALNGTLVYAEAAPASSGARLAWWTPAGTTAAVGAATDVPPLLSPDERRVAEAIGEGTRSDIWVGDLERGPAARLTHEGINVAPVWSPDGRTVYFARRTTGAFEIWRRDADAAAPAVRLFSGPRNAVPLAISPDGAQLAFAQSGDRTRLDLWAMPLDRQTQPKVLVQSPFDDTGAAWSPDGRLLAYQSNESGRWDVYVQRLSDGRRRVISSEGGTAPSWSADAGVVYYHSSDRLMRVAIGAGDLSAAAPTIVAQVPGMTPVAVTRDGRVLFQSQRRTVSDRAIVVLAWERELRQLLGPPSPVMPR